MAIYYQRMSHPVIITCKADLFCRSGHWKLYLYNPFKNGRKKEKWRESLDIFHCHAILYYCQYWLKEVHNATFS